MGLRKQFRGWENSHTAAPPRIFDQCCGHFLLEGGECFPAFLTKHLKGHFYNWKVTTCVIHSNISYFIDEKIKYQGKLLKFPRLAGCLMCCLMSKPDIPCSAYTAPYVPVFPGRSKAVPSAKQRFSLRTAQPYRRSEPLLSVP